MTGREKTERDGGAAADAEDAERTEETRNGDDADTETDVVRDVTDRAVERGERVTAADLKAAGIRPERIKGALVAAGTMMLEQAVELTAQALETLEGAAKADTPDGPRQGAAGNG